MDSSQPMNKATVCITGDIDDFEVEDIERTIEDLKNREVRMIDEVPRKGAHASKIAFIHPHSTGGVLIELSQKKEGD